jgi:hypothetical protein
LPSTLRYRRSDLILGKVLIAYAQDRIPQRKAANLGYLGQVMLTHMPRVCLENPDQLFLRRLAEADRKRHVHRWLLANSAGRQIRDCTAAGVNA